MQMRTGKKLRICVVFAALLLVVQAVCGCGGSNLNKYAENISELRDRLFAAESAEYKVSAISGTREDPYVLDGESKSKRAFTVLTVTPAHFASDKTYRYRVQIGEQSFEGDLMPHPFAKSLSVDIPAAAKDAFSVCIICDGEQTLELANAPVGDNIGAEKALAIALDKLKNELKRFRSKGKLHAEIYVRLMENPIDGNGGYFWYVAFVGKNKETVAILLKSDTGAVSATRI